MISILIVGSTGVVGKSCLEKLNVFVKKNSVKVTALSRRPLGDKYSHVNNIVINLQDESEIVNAIPQVDVVICCLGTTMKKAGSKAAFYLVDYTMTLNVCKAAFAKGAKHCILVSSQGANEKSLFFYPRTKGEIEKAIANIGFSKVSIFRPSFLDDHNTRSDFRPVEQLTVKAIKKIQKITGFKLVKFLTPVEILTSTIVQLAFSELRGKEVSIFESTDISVK